MAGNASLHDAYAPDYDHQVLAFGSYVADALFGLCYEYLQPGQRLLDLGIGSGLSAAPFAKSGLTVAGMDFSPAMLDICRAKGIAAELKQHDLLHAPWPYAGDTFDHAICCDVFHFIEGLKPVFVEVDRVLRLGSIFAFATKAPVSSNAGQGDFDHHFVEGLDIFEHHSEYLERLIERAGFERLKQLRCFVGADIFWIWVVRNSSRPKGW